MQIYTDRHALHQIPELELDLPKTQNYLRQALSGLTCRVFVPLGSALCARLGLEMETGSSKQLLLDCLERGGVAICNTSGDREGYTGLFSSGGHYVCAVGLTREGLVRVWDPNRYAGKYEGPGRKGRVQLDGDDVLVPAGGLLADCAEREPALYCFHRQTEQPSAWAEISRGSLSIKPMA